MAGVPVLTGLSMSMTMEDRIALLGANGNGKSTFAKLLAGRLEPMAGRLRRPGKLRVGYFAQHQEAELEPLDTALDHIGRALPQAPPTLLRSQLARFRFGSGPGEHADRLSCRAASAHGCCWLWRRATRRNCSSWTSLRTIWISMLATLSCVL